MDIKVVFLFCVSIKTNSFCIKHALNYDLHSNKFHFFVVQQHAVIDTITESQLTTDDLHWNTTERLEV